MIAKWNFYKCMDILSLSLSLSLSVCLCTHNSLFGHLWSQFSELVLKVHDYKELWKNPSQQFSICLNQVNPLLVYASNGVYSFVFYQILFSNYQPQEYINVRKFSFFDLYQIQGDKWLWMPSSACPSLQQLLQFTALRFVLFE